MRAEWDEVTHIPLLQGAVEPCTSLPGRVWSHRARWADTVVMLEHLAPGESWGGQAGGAAGPCVITVHSVCPAVGFLWSTSKAGEMQSVLKHQDWLVGEGGSVPTCPTKTGVVVGGREESCD